MSDKPPRSRQEAQIRSQWPRATKQLTSTFFPAENWAVSDNHGHNAAGYLLWALQRMETFAQTNHIHRNFTRDELDLAASREIYYQWSNARHFNSVPAALATCLLNLVKERPEKLMEARRLQAGLRGPAVSRPGPADSGPLTAIPSSLAGRTSEPVPIGQIVSDSPTLTHRNSSPTPSQAVLPPSFTCNSFVWANPSESYQSTHGPTATAV